jgi:TM2 domain-containing membrane protein YozV
MTQPENALIEIPEDLKAQIPPAVLRKVAMMEEVNQEAFVSEFKKKKKSNVFAFLLANGGCHYFYLGKYLMGFLYWGTVGGFGIWWFVDLFRVKGMVAEFNKTVAINVLRDIQVLN